MHPTIYLSQLLGLAFLIISSAMFVGKEKALTAVKALINDDGLLYSSELLGLVTGLAIVLSHNVWSGGVAEVLVTILGWMIFLKSALALFVSDLTLRKLYNHIKFEKYYYVWVVVVFLLGVYLTYSGFVG